MNNKEFFMSAALQEAKKAYNLGEIPIGAVVVKDGKIIASAHNMRETGKCSLYHAEILAIHQACKALGGWRLHECDLYVTLEPCIMCSGAISQSRIKNLYFGAFDPKGGAVLSASVQDSKGLFPNTLCEGGILIYECSNILKQFFKEMRTGHINNDK
jgi:tRNA(adenine34) deaminase